MNSILCTLLLSLIIVVPSAKSGQDMKHEHGPKLSFATGPNINDRVPDFALPDQYGVMRSIGDLVKSKGAILNFYRSASWWPYCKKELVEFQQKKGEFDRKGVAIIGISNDPVNILEAFSKEHKINYPLLSDAKSEVIKMFGILNTKIDATNKRYGIPYPGIYIVDNELRVKSKQFEASYAERPTAESVLVRHFNKELKSHIKYFSTPYLSGNIAITDTLLFPGQLADLVVNISTKDNFHI